MIRIARSLLHEQARACPADADPRRRILSAGGAFATYVPTSDAPCVDFGHRRVCSSSPISSSHPRTSRYADGRLTQSPRASDSADPVKGQRA
jgi:hypothetical protein